MILKESDSKQPEVEKLQALLDSAPESIAKKVKNELRTLHAGVKGEKESAYYIDFDYGNSENYTVIHDLRLEVDGQVAQIDHLLIGRFLQCFVLETKHFRDGMKITEEGEFLRFNSFKNRYEGMPSPIAQNDRHIAVLKRAFKQIRMPKRLGLSMTPTFKSFILVSSGSRIIRPKKFDTSMIVKADLLHDTVSKFIDSYGVVNIMSSVSKIVSLETITNISQQLIAMHRPIQFDYAGKFGLTQPHQQEVAATSPSLVTVPEVGKGASSSSSVTAPEGVRAPTCRHCESKGLTIEHGRYGYYFKCKKCSGNTPITVQCAQGHRERIRKSGNQFYRDCAECSTSMLYYENPV